MPDSDPLEIHQKALVIDGANNSKYDRNLVQGLLTGGVTAVNATVAVLDHFKDTMLRICRWRQMFSQFDTIMMPVRQTEDIEAAKEYGKLGVILGLQNTAAIEEDLELIPVLKGMGIRVMELTYNERNYVADGCLERVDAGLARFGIEVIKRMNEHGIVIDVSHAGPQSTLEAIQRSERPVAAMHSSPEALYDYPGNKTDEQIKRLADKGGVFGCSFWPFLHKKGMKAKLSDYVDSIDYVVDLVGINFVSIASDFFFNRYKKELQKHLGGRGKPWWTIEVDWPVEMPEGVREPEDYPNITAELVKRGYSERDIMKILGGNLMRLFEQVW